MSKGSKTQTVTQSSEPAAYVQDAQQNYLNTVKNFTQPFVGTSPSTTVAGLTPDQTLSADLARGMAQNEFTSSPSQYYPVTQAAQNYSPFFSSNPALMSYAASPSPALAPSTSAGYAATANPYGGLVTGDSIRGLLNPYTQDVLDPTLANMRRELDKTQAQIGARNASSAAFGGSRGALQSAEANRAFGDQVALTTANLMAQGYDKATATALANAGRAQEANIYNAGQTNNMAQFNASLLDKAISANQSATNAAAEANAQRLQQAAAANQAAQNTFAESNAQRAQQAAAANAAAENNMRQFNTAALQTGATTQNTLANDEASRQRAALAQLLGIGNLEQTTAQNALNQPTSMLKLLGAAIPGNYGSTSTSQYPDNSPSTAQTLGGLGLGILGMGADSIGGSLLGSLFGLSDRRDKTDIQKLGTDPGSGLNMYAYRYKGDPKGTPKVVGPMAQEVEKKYPGAVHEIGGHKVINGGALRAMMGVT
jgi:hypothetical protein